MNENEHKRKIEKYWTHKFKKHQNTGDINSSKRDNEQEWIKYWDDIIGKELETTLVEKARKEEMDEYNKHNVYAKVPIHECWATTGNHPLERDG